MARFLLEEEKRERLRLLAKARGVLVDRVAELFGRLEHPPAGFFADRGMPDKARETVGWDTPASAAMSNEVGRLCVIQVKS